MQPDALLLGHKVGVELAPGTDRAGHRELEPVTTSQGL
jgi:hypothetical protein